MEASKTTRKAANVCIGPVCGEGRLNIHGLHPVLCASDPKGAAAEMSQPLPTRFWLI